MMTTKMTGAHLRTYYRRPSYFRIGVGESKMLRRCLPLLTLSFTLSAAALFGQDLPDRFVTPSFSRSLLSTRRTCIPGYAAADDGHL